MPKVAGGRKKLRKCGIGQGGRVRSNRSVMSFQATSVLLDGATIRKGTIDCGCHTSNESPEFSDKKIPEKSGTLCDLKLLLYI
jgi:hypothetical protein